MTSAFKRFGALACALMVGVLVAVACVAPRQALAYSDTSSSEWYATEGWLDYVTANRIMTGYSDGSDKFGPWDAITRGQVATVLYRIANPTSDATTNAAHFGTVSNFSDVQTGVYYTAAIEWCRAEGVITGYTYADGTPTGEFRPDKDVSRAELATMAYRFARYMGADMSADASAYGATMDHAFTDASADYAYAVAPLTWTCDRGVLGGVYDDNGDRWLDVRKGACRAEAAKVFTVLKRDVVERAGSYTVTFDSNGGTAVAAQSLASGQKVQRAFPTRSGYEFAGWFTDAALTREYKFDADVTGSLTLYAKWDVAAAAHDEGEAPDNDVAAQEAGTTVTATSSAAADAQAPVTGETAGVAADDAPAASEPAGSASADGDADSAAGEAPAAPAAGDADGVSLGENETPVLAVSAE